MRHPLAFVLALSCLAVPAAAAVRAAPVCPDRPIFDVAALRSELMVLATTCHDDTQYNAFMRRYQPYLLSNEHALDSYFRREYGRRGRSEHDSYVTSLANAQSNEGLRQGADFCPRSGVVFSEVMALDSPQQLPEYAAGKGFLPASLLHCGASAPPGRAVRHRR